MLMFSFALAETGAAKHAIIETAVRVLFDVTQALYERFGESLIWAALVVLAILPFGRRIVALRPDDDDDERISQFINCFLIILSLGIGVRAAIWVASQRLMLELGLIGLLASFFGFVVGLAVALGIWWCSFRFGRHVAPRLRRWLRKVTNRPDILETFGKNWHPEPEKISPEAAESAFKTFREVWAQEFPTSGIEWPASPSEVAEPEKMTGIDKVEAPATDLAEVAERSHAAAVQGYPAAQRNLGFLYETGCGVPKNANLARMWYRKAAAQGDPEASIALARLQENSALHP